MAKSAKRQPLRLQARRAFAAFLALNALVMLAVPKPVAVVDAVEVDLNSAGETQVAYTSRIFIIFLLYFAN